MEIRLYNAQVYYNKDNGAIRKRASDSAAQDGAGVPHIVGCTDGAA